MYEKELAKLEGHSAMLEQEQMTLQGAVTAQDVFQGLKTGTAAMDALNQQMNIEQMEDIQDKIQDQMAQQEEMTDFFVQNANADKDELEEELAAMIAEDEAEKFAEIPVGLDSIKPDAQPAIA